MEIGPQALRAAQPKASRCEFFKGSCASVHSGGWPGASFDSFTQFYDFRHVPSRAGWPGGSDAIESCDKL